MSDEQTFTHETPVMARVWFEGRRIFEDSVVAVECDGDEVVLTTEDGDETYAEDEWDELTVGYR